LKLLPVSNGRNIRENNALTPISPLTLSIKPLTLPDGIYPLALFTPIAKQPWAMWLDSCQSSHVDARYDILVWQPEATLTTLGQTTTIVHSVDGRSTTSGEDPLLLLRATQQQLLKTTSPSKDHLPFLGGALGYFAYDLGRRFEKVPEQAQHDIHVPDMAVGIYSQAVIYDNKSAQYYLLCPEQKRSSLEGYLRNLLHTPKQSCNFTLTSPWQANMEKSSYVGKFKQVQQYLLNGDCYQINLAQRFSSRYQGDEFQAYCVLRLENQAPFSAFIRLENAAILSVSPERFLQLSQGKIQSKPIKGTMPRSVNSAQDIANAQILKNSSKDRAENVMIVDLLRNDISKVCQAGSVVVPTLFDIESFPAVHHLVSTVEGKLDSKYDACDLLRAAFPGGSITGAPKIRAMEIIEQLEPHRRSVYCGSIGYISTCGTMDSSITIRTLVCEKAPNELPSHMSLTPGNIYCWAGGGLVADSTAESEYQETFDKVHCILPILSKLT